MCHDTTKPFLLKAVSKVVRSKEFDQKCVFRQNVLKVYGPKPNEVSSQSQDEEEAKAAEILDSLVSKEAVGEILAVNSAKKPAGHQGQVSTQANQPAPNTLQRGAKMVGPALPQTNKGLKNPQISSLQQGASAVKGSYQPNQQVNSYNDAAARMRYLNSLRTKGLTPKPFSRGSQNVYTGYRPRIPGKPLPSSTYGMSYTNTPHRLAQYTRTQSASYGNTWSGSRPPVYKGIDLRGGPGSMRPGNVLHMARKPQTPIVLTLNSRFQNPLKNQVNRIPKAPAYGFISPNTQKQYNTSPQSGPISVGNHVTSAKSRPISNTNQMASSKAKAIVWGDPVKPQAPKPNTVHSGSGSGEMPVAKHGEPKPIDPKRAVYGMGGKKTKK